MPDSMTAQHVLQRQTTNLLKQHFVVFLSKKIVLKIIFYVLLTFKVDVARLAGLL